MRRIALLGPLKAGILCALAAGTGYPQATIGNCPSFPAGNIWNEAVDDLPVHPQTAAFISKIGPAAGLRMDDTMPINLVSHTPAKILVGGISTPESDAGAYAIPDNAGVEKGSDAHLIVVDQDTCLLYELFDARLSRGKVTASSAAKWDLNSNALRPEGWTSADAAGLPIMPGVLRYAEVASGRVSHALRFSAPYTRGNGVYQWPARHYASHNPDGPPMGQRFRLKSSVDISRYPASVQVILKGLKRYGMMLSDNGIPWSMQHDADPRWNLTELMLLHQVLGENIEAVDVSSLMSDPNSGLAGTAAGMIMTTDALGRLNPAKLGPGLAIINGALVLSR